MDLKKFFNEASQILYNFIIPGYILYMTVDLWDQTSICF